MHSRLVSVASLVVLSLMTSASLALAEEPAAAPGAAPPKEAKEEHAEGRYPVAEAERPLTLPSMVLMGELDLDFPRVNILGAFGAASATTFANVSIGASFGVTDDLTVRAQVLPLQLAGGGGFHYGQSSAVFGGIDNPGPGVGATYRFLKGDFEVGAALDLSLITAQSFSGVVIAPGVPVRVHVGKSLRIDTGAYLPITRASLSVATTNFGTTSTGASTTGLIIPVSVLYDITEPIHIGAATGFTIGDFSDVGDSAAIPLGLFAGYAIGGKDGPVLDIDPFFTFPGLITPGGSNGTNSGSYVFGVSVGGFLYL